MAIYLSHICPFKVCWFVSDTCSHSLSSYNDPRLLVTTCCSPRPSPRPLAPLFRCSAMHRRGCAALFILVWLRTRLDSNGCDTRGEVCDFGALFRRQKRDLREESSDCVITWRRGELVYCGRVMGVVIATSPAPTPPASRERSRRFHCVRHLCAVRRALLRTLVLWSQEEIRLCNCTVQGITF